MYRKLTLAIALFVCCVVAQAQTPAPSPATTTSLTDDKAVATRTVKTVTVLPEEKSGPLQLTRLEKPPVIDGKLDDDVWQKATVLKDFYQTNPGDNTPPSYPTEVFIGYDATNLYIGFRAKDDPSRVRATVAKRDDVFGTDD